MFTKENESYISGAIFSGVLYNKFTAKSKGLSWLKIA